MTLRYCSRLAAALAVMAAPAPVAFAQNLIGLNVTEPGQSDVAKTLVLGVDKSTVIDLPRPAADVVITNSAVADAVVQNRKRLIFRGVEAGETNAFIFDDHGREIVNLEIRVEPDLTALNDLIARHLPDARVMAEAINGRIVLTGGVANAIMADQVRELVALYGEDEAVDMMRVAAKDQVLLEVRVIEMQRTYLKQLGIEPELSIAIGDEVGEGPTIGTVFDGGTDIVDGFGAGLGYTNLDAGAVQFDGSLDVAALERVGIARTLAEPNITALSGEDASFLAGGEVPVATPADENGVVGIEYKQFGVSLGFTPTVLSEDRISLKVQTEVSEIGAQGAVAGAPTLSTRRVESTIELPSGQSMMLAGLIQSRTRQQLDSVPGIKELPVLGGLFQSRDFNNDESELVIIITPYLVDPTTKRALRTPADGFANPTDLNAILFGKINRVYGKGEAPLSPETYRAPVGFIEE